MWVNNSTYQYSQLMPQNAPTLNVGEKKKLSKKQLKCTCQNYLWRWKAIGGNDESFTSNVRFTTMESAKFDAKMQTNCGFYTIFLNHECSRPVTLEIKYEYYNNTGELEFESDILNTETFSDSSSLSKTSTSSDDEEECHAYCVNKETFSPNLSGTSDRIRVKI